MTVDLKNILLLDALGALLSALFLGIVLVHFEQYIGMPTSTLYSLAAIPCVFMVYSLTCYLSAIKNREWSVRIIILANSLYAILSLSLVIYHFDLLTKLGIAYFLVELVVLICIINFEFKSVKSVAFNKKQ